MLEENQETIEADAQPVGFLERGAPNTGEAPQVVKALAGIGFLALIAAAIVSETWRKPLIVVAILLTIVIAHELGHFLIARRAGMACSEFFVGFGPRLWYRKRGETEFGLKLLPLGGYVRILGMTNLEKVDPALEKRTYRQAPFRWRFATIMGGVTVNFVLAFLCFWAVAAGQGEFGTSNRINQLVEKCRSLDDPNSPANTECPAAAAGIKADDVIVAIDGMKITTGKQVTASLEPRLGRRTEVTVMRKGRELSFTLIPVPKEDRETGGLLKLKDKTTAGLIGVQPGIATFPIKGAEAPGWAWNQMWTGTTQTVGLLGKLVTPDGARKQVDRATGNGSSSASSSARGNAPGTDTSRVKSDPCAPSGDDVERPRSVIGIVQIGQCTTSNWDYVAIAGSINLALGIFNMVPLVPLDGGHATVAIYEAIASKIRRRRVYADYRKLAPVAALFITFLLFLFITSATSDVRELVR